MLFDEFHWRQANILDVFARVPKAARFRDRGGNEWWVDTLCEWSVGEHRNYVDSYGGRWDECEVYCGPERPSWLDGDEWDGLCYVSE